MGTCTKPINAWETQAGMIAPVGFAPGFSRRFTGLYGPTGSWRHSRSGRGSAAALTVALHAAALTLVMLSRGTHAASEKPGLIAFDVPTSGEHKPQQQISRTPHRRVPKPILALPTFVQVTPIDLVPGWGVASPEISADALSPAMPAGCDLTQPVQDALRSSDDVLRQLPEIPADRRSVANAIVVWNEGWIVAGTAPAQAALATIRQTVTQALAAASAECRNQLQRGPRLIYLPGAAGTTPGSDVKVTVLALGSGQWTWQQLVDGGQPVPAGTIVGPDPPPAVFAMARTAAVAPGQTPGLEALLASLIHNRSPTALP